LRRRARKSLNLRCVSREDTPDAPRAGEGSWTRERDGLDPQTPAVPLAIHRFRPRTVPLPGPEADATGFASPLPDLPIIGRALRGVRVVLTGGDPGPVARLSTPSLRRSSGRNRRRAAEKSVPFHGQNLLQTGATGWNPADPHPIRPAPARPVSGTCRHPAGDLPLPSGNPPQGAGLPADNAASYALAYIYDPCAAWRVQRSNILSLRFPVHKRDSDAQIVHILVHKSGPRRRCAASRAFPKSALGLT